MRDTNHYPLLREVEKKYGKRVLSYTDCVHLSKAIAEQTGFRLNVSTLRRFFGLVKATYPPSPTTKDILAKFIGYNNFEHFHSLQQLEPGPVNDETSLLLHYLENLFSTAPAATYQDPAWVAIMQQTILFMESQPQLLDGFQRLMAKSELGRTIYFEQFIHIDQLNGAYSRGLRYYLGEKLTKKGKIFSHSLLALRSYLSDDPVALALHHQEVVQYSPDTSLDPFICARHFATQLFFQCQHHEALYSVLQECRMFFQHLSSAKENYQGFPCFELTVSEALVLVGQPLEALYYLRERKRKKNGYQSPPVGAPASAAFELYEAIALTLLGDAEKARKIFKKISTADFYFLSRQYHNALYLLVESALFNGKAAVSVAQLEDLVRTLGFVRLHQLFANLKVVNKKEHRLAMPI